MHIFNRVGALIAAILITVALFGAFNHFTDAAASKARPATCAVNRPSTNSGPRATLHQRPLQLQSRDKGASPLNELSNLILDDGTQETSIGFGTTHSYPGIWLNRFSPISGSYPLTVSQISVQFPATSSAGIDLQGQPVDLLIYVDTTNSGSPLNATKLQQLPATVTVADGRTFSNYSIPTMMITSGDIYIGFSDTFNSGQLNPLNYPVPEDTNNSQQRSWILGHSNGNNPDYDCLSNNDIHGTTDQLGSPGNWMIRATVDSQTCAVQFADVGGNVFLQAIRELNCRGVVNGTDATHYSPGGTATRGQFAKVVVLGFGVPFYTPSTGTFDFSDVPPSYFAYSFIETGYHAGILSGFDAGTCTAHGVAYPCYLPNQAITRGQLTKLVVNAGGYPLYTPTSGQTFSDVPPTNVFYVSIETAHYNNIINGYPDNTFRPNQNIRRDQMAQIVYAGINDVATPIPTNTPTDTPTNTDTPTDTPTP